jgi:hypothetical protein
VEKEVIAFAEAGLVRLAGEDHVAGGLIDPLVAEALDCLASSYPLGQWKGPLALHLLLLLTSFLADHVVELIE